ncbi:MAG: 1-(5-phosphoribosyl)-5-[(5-phosphoribosylamino)methylideneamino]imidazole-4-carboxamide isomerase [Deltaproteobacteria bacterium]|nr:MAG: 1-(5-phosphoribosyl)-5-[(5-phosphoribosylamino)methylideneamino]imidazole-4-carboxamide isomerase [Deltaproteobacteria bacterium]
MLIIPAIDLKDGKCVRLSQGKMDQVTLYSDNPAEIARKWEGMGAELIHLVDLDGASAGRPMNTEAIRKIIDSVKIPLQLGGGIRDQETAEEYFSLGIDRIILGTAACERPELIAEICRKYPGKILTSIDAREGKVAIKGWEETTDREAIELARRFEDLGVAAIIYTDIKRDGMLSGPNIEETRKLAQSLKTPIIAAGGVSKLEDIRNLMEIEQYGLEGIITGKALYSGKLDLREAIALTQQR